MTTVITERVYRAGMDRLERAAKAAGEADAKAMLIESFDEALDYDPVYQRQSMSLDEVVRGKAGQRVLERVDALVGAAIDRRISFEPHIGHRYRDGAIGEIRYRIKVAYVDAWDDVVRKAARARGRVPTYMDEG